MSRKNRPNFFGRIVLFYKSNYLDSLIAACGAIYREMRTNFKTVLKRPTLKNDPFYFIILRILRDKVPESRSPTRRLYLRIASATVRMKFP